MLKQHQPQTSVAKYGKIYVSTVIPGILSESMTRKDIYSIFYCYWKIYQKNGCFSGRQDLLNNFVKSTSHAKNDRNTRVPPWVFSLFGPDDLILSMIRACICRLWSHWGDGMSVNISCEVPAIFWLSFKSVSKAMMLLHGWLKTWHFDIKGKQWSSFAAALKKTHAIPQ